MRYRAGWGKCDLGITPRGYAMQGYGMWHHRARAQQSPLYARALFLADDRGQALFFCCLDTGYVTHAMRDGVCRRLAAELGPGFREAALVLTCTHTHSGPGGCTHDVLYNVVTPGFVPEHLQHVVTACTTALLQAHASAAPTTLELVRGRFDNDTEVAWNRSLKAYNRNPDVLPRRETETHLALDREMQVLALRRDGRLLSLLSLFGVHATCVGSGQPRHDGDNKGYAASHAEQRLTAQGSLDAVAIFAQGTAGDVSPHYHGPGQAARRRAIRGDAEYAYARHNGEYQSRLALTLAGESPPEPVTGAIDAILTYVDFSQVQAEPRFANGHRDAWTSDPCHGVAFFTGTPVDGPGMPRALGLVARRLAQAVRQHRLRRPGKYTAEENRYFQRLYAAQGPKAILLEAGRKRVLGQPLDRLALPDFADPLVKELKAQARRGAIRQSALVPSVLPLQIIRIGTLVILCCPGEFTTTAGRRLRQTVADTLGSDIAQVLICTYCNDYMGYVTTYEEYQEQAYEGGHTIYGQWTLAAFQTRFAALAAELLKPDAERGHDRHTRPPAVPQDELALRSNLPVPE